MISPAAVKGSTGSGVLTGDSDLLPRHAIFRTHDLDEARGHLCGVFAEHRVDYLPRERYLKFRHRQAKLGAIALNSLEWGAGVMVSAPLLPDFYLLQFTLTGACELWQETHHSFLPARSVTIVNPGRAFKKAWMPRTRQLLLRIDKHLVERELRAWTGGNEGGSVEFDTPPVEDLDTVGTLGIFVKMVCEDLKNEASDLSHPLVADRLASGLVALLLTSMPHNKQRALEAVNQPAAPFFVRRVEEFIQKHASDPITLADLTGIAGVSTRALQTNFRRFRNTTPMAHLRAMRLELARTELKNARRRDLSVAAVASALGFSHFGRFAREYQLRFGELPSQTVYRSSVECSR